MKHLSEIEITPMLYRGLPADADLLTVLLLSTCHIDCPGFSDHPEHIDCERRARAAFHVLRGKD